MNEPKYFLNRSACVYDSMHTCYLEGIKHNCVCTFPIACMHDLSNPGPYNLLLKLGIETTDSSMGCPIILSFLKVIKRLEYRIKVGGYPMKILDIESY